ASSSETGWPAATWSPSTTITLAMRPGTSAATFASRFGSAARLPFTMRLSTITSRATFATVTSGTGSPDLASPSPPCFPQAVNDSTTRKTTAFRLFRLIKWRPHDFFQHREGTLCDKQAVEIRFSNIIQAALRVDKCQQAGFPRLIAVFRHVQQLFVLR